MEVDSKQKQSKTDFQQFLEDYWIELRNNDALIALLTSWGVFERPTDFQSKPWVRLLLFTIQAFLAIGLTVQLGCTRDPIPEGPAIIMTIILITIPVEILNLLWFRVVKSDDEVSKSETSDSKKCCTCIIQFVGKFLGSLLGFIVLGYSTVFFVLTFVGIHPGCTEDQKYTKAYHVVLFQFLLVPLFMSLPYWRRQSSVLSLLGELGPVIGLLMHIKKHGLHPPPPSMASQPDYVL